jgi:predicted SprT family Zn-dependent metalloprotease
MNIQTATILADSLMRKHGLISLGWTLELDNSKRRFGMCTHSIRAINLSMPLTELNDEFHVKDTILHEIAHALVGRGHGHGNVWKRKCIEIGAKPVRCYSIAEVTQPQMRYYATCGSCGRVHQKCRIINLEPRRLCNCQKGISWNNRVLLNFVARW